MSNAYTFAYTLAYTLSTSFFLFHCSVDVCFMCGVPRGVLSANSWCHAAAAATAVSVTNKKPPNVDKSCPNVISLEKLKILTTLQNLPKMWAIWAKQVLPQDLKSCPKYNKNCPIWSHCSAAAATASRYSMKRYNNRVSLFPMGKLRRALTSKKKHSLPTDGKGRYSSGWTLDIVVYVDRKHGCSTYSYVQALDKRKRILIDWRGNWQRQAML